MLEGINVLNTIPIMEYSIWFYIGSYVAILGICGFILAAISEAINGLILFVILLVLGFGCLVTTEGDKKPSGKYTYQVTISDDVKMQEFNEKYVIQSQEGKIYTIREKTNQSK